MLINRHYFTGLRVSGFLLSLAYPDFERSETAKLRGHAFSKAVLNLIEEPVDYRVDVFSVGSELVVNVLNRFFLLRFVAYVL